MENGDSVNASIKEQTKLADGSYKDIFQTKKKIPQSLTFVSHLPYTDTILGRRSNMAIPKELKRDHQSPG